MTQIYDQIAHYYDLTHAALVEDIPLLLKLAEQAAGPILELGCGTGRLLRPFAEAGFVVVGVDNSEGMLALARQQVGQLPQAVQRRVELVAQDFTRLKLATNDFGLGIVPYNTFLHLDTAAKRATLRGVGRCLGENGRLFLDVANPFILASLVSESDHVLENELVDPQTGKRIEQWARTTVVDEGQTVQVDWLYRGEGRGETAVVAHYHYLYPHELDLLLQQTGFRLEALWGDYQQTPFNQDSERLLLLARR